MIFIFYNIRIEHFHINAHPQKRSSERNGYPQQTPRRNAGADRHIGDRQMIDADQAFISRRDQSHSGLQAGAL
jgi:hypothetical protein